MNQQWPHASFDTRSGFVQSDAKNNINIRAKEQVIFTYRIVCRIQLVIRFIIHRRFAYLNWR